MQTNNLTLSPTTERPFELAKTSAKMTISEVFAERKGSYLNEFTLFVAHFNSIPNFIHEVDIDCKKATNWFAENYKSEIKDFYYDKRYFNRSKKAEIDDIFYFLYDDLIVDFDTNCSTVRFLYRKTELSKVEEIVNAIHKFKKRKQKQKPEISLLVNSMSGIETKSLQITKPKLSIEDNYNEDFKEIHRTILKDFLVKTIKDWYYFMENQEQENIIHQILNCFFKKDVIFLPPNMASAITNPSLISILIDNPNSVFVIEDAENIVVDREKDGSSPVSALLNISDGLLADCLNVQIICSFNTDISKIDSALMRKGRLIAKYEFKELEIEKAQQLSNKLGFDTNINSPMTLTSIYNQDEKDFQQSRKTNPIGFQAINKNR
ncbi:MAG: hypothetical protein IPN13_06930 [Bacteroidetes bacterium]|nr:hypothetical protein [Bacteroidota bacterium]